MNSILDLQNLIQGFKLSCQTENKSPKTIEWYTCFLDRFHQFLKRNNYPTGVKKDQQKPHQDIYSFPAAGSQNTACRKTIIPIYCSGLCPYVKVVFQLVEAGRIHRT